MKRENRKLLHAEADRLGLDPKVSLDILLDAYNKLEKRKGKSFAGIPLGLLYVTWKADEQVIPAMPEVLNTGRAAAECCLIEDSYCYVAVARASSTKLANGPFDDMEQDSLRTCIFSTKGKGVSGFLLVDGVWQPFENQLGPKAKEACFRFFRMFMEIAEKEGKPDDADQEKIPTWTTKNLNSPEKEKDDDKEVHE